METAIRIRTCLLFVLAAVASLHALQLLRFDRAKAAAQPMAVTAKLLRTSHYEITSTASGPESRLVAEAVESLYAEYMTFFAESIRAAPNRHKLKLTLYKDQQEFKQHNQASSWAEAFYLAPNCHAYFA
jgi:hypothetical protein